MAKSLTSILSQIERLQKEAAAIQAEVVTRIRKDIAKFGLTPEQLFGRSTAAKTANVKAKPAQSKAVKYADGKGNTWGGMGKRPGWIHEALAAGKSLDEFLTSKQAGETAPAKAAPKKAVAPKKVAAGKKASEPKKAAAPKQAPAPKKAAVAKKAVTAKPAATPKRKAAAKAKAQVALSKTVEAAPATP